MSNPLKSIIKNIRLIMVEKDINQKAFAEKMGLSKQAISTFFSGEHEPRLGKILQTAQALGVEPFELLMTPEERAEWKRFKRLEGAEANSRSFRDVAAEQLELRRQKKVKKGETG